MASDDTIQCSNEDLEPFLRNTFSIQLGNATTNMTGGTDVGIVSQLLPINDNVRNSSK